MQSLFPGTEETIEQLEYKERDYAHRSAVALGPFVIAEVRIADRDDVTALEEMLGDPAGIHEHPVLAAPVDNPRLVAVCRYYGVSAADVWRVQLDVIVGCSTDGQAILEQRKSQ